MVLGLSDPATDIFDTLIDEGGGVLPFDVDGNDVVLYSECVLNHSNLWRWTVNRNDHSVGKGGRGCSDPHDGSGKGHNTNVVRAHL